jgi:hypothetical protein
MLAGTAQVEGWVLLDVNAKRLSGLEDKFVMHFKSFSLLSNSIPTYIVVRYKENLER